MRSSLLVCALFCLLAAADAQPKPMKLVSLADTDPGAVCLDGSPGTFYFSAATQDHSNDWLIFFQGGGWCYSEADCLQRSVGGPLGSSKSLLDNSNPGLSGLNSLDCQSNPDFCNFNVVHLVRERIILFSFPLA